MVASHNFNLEQPTPDVTGSHGYLLEVQDGEQRRALRLYDGRVIVGSHPCCHLRLGDHTVSRCHLEVIVTEKGLAIRDMASTNGTWLDGHRIPAATIGVGDTVTIGHCEIFILALFEPRPPCAPPWARVGPDDTEADELSELTDPEFVT